jgi:Family of unknown function (DUF5762)
MNDTDTESKTKKTIPFWAENPNILMKPEYLMEFFPSGDMSYNQKLNAISRTVIMVTLLLFAVNPTPMTLIYGIVTFVAIYLVYYYHRNEKRKSDKQRLENMSVMMEGDSDSNPAIAALGKSIPLEGVFDDPTSQNPFSNVLVTDYLENPNKKPAPPAFNQNVNGAILTQAKHLVQEANPDQPDIADKLFKDLGEQLFFEQSLRPFYSNSATTIPNDQQAFSDFCYGSMVSCKEGNQFACAKSISTRHTLT